MYLPLEILRKKIDILDIQLIASLWTDISEQPPEIPLMMPPEYNRLLCTDLHFSSLTWQYIAERLELSKDIGKTKKYMGIKNAIDEERKNVMIESRILWAPDTLRMQVKELYEILHDISVRIQSDILVSTEVLCEIDSNK